MTKSDLEEKAVTKITEYMIEQNRPYSAIDVHTNLRQEFGKAMVLKVLESCVATGVLKEKLIGKQKIFFANQEKLEICNESEIASYDSQIDDLSEKLKALVERNKEIQNELRDVSNTLTTEDLKSAVTDLQQKINKMKLKLAHLETSMDPLVAEDSKKALQMEFEIFKVMQKRKRLATDMINAIMENSPMSKRELLDSIGIELSDG